MNQLLLYRGEGIKFAPAVVVDALRAIPGVTDIEERQGAGWIIQALLDHQNDSTIVRLAEDGESISIVGTGAASLKAVVEMLARIGPELRLVDTDYTFDVSLGGVTTMDGLQTRIGEGRAAAQASAEG